ncbi:hydroxyacylglutathione hydrolase [Ruegeria sp. 2205SS24-7]|uniref:hydroxyacylglutathione hydrolase n=1 Tax=Ruegeria discodermiae TaxID=3064389 RepID=UPI00274178E4|nr:hydroxyacylglutathione hydrolase [Ruegeria sp. 2205SS24-7]MDP5219265.1 hydroxyacylglutathione hydrolase [Ruegeria sp. 2205SS24-7]
MKGQKTMPLEIVTIPCLSDNYAFLIHAPGSGLTALVDAPEAAPIEAELDRRGWTLDQIWLTHHHWDHVDGVEALRSRFGASVVGAAADAQRLPKLDMEVREGSVFSLSREDVQVIEVPGHTVGHIAFYMPESHAVFTADSLMALGCGRLFEGSPEQMWTSLNKLAALPDDTIVYSGHEYTQANGRFAETIEPENAALKKRIADISAARAVGRSTVPSALALEKATNPFLRANEPGIQANLGMTGSAPVDVFAEIRARKDRF